MERRRFIELGAAAVAATIAAGLAGCGKKEQAPSLGSQEKLWNMTAAGGPVNEPVDLAYGKGTPAAYRDASFGKADPNFKPKTGGG